MTKHDITQEQAAKVIGVRRETLNAKLAGKQPFKALEIKLLVDKYGMNMSYFFTNQVSRTITQEAIMVEVINYNAKGERISDLSKVELDYDLSATIYTILNRKEQIA